ncbi:hypothetical protein [Butyrivibrio fibrisolvens]|uniref:hypothetical protein n=1 Tax=Butyrivibrio fibrisolvens TaxID=831 RepID=UPI000482F923|nr:hypothetical protein [Butyrivibrio fibrisolvens]
MARLGCRCGAEMTNTIAPSNNIISIYYMKEVMDAIDLDPQIRLWDFYTGWDEKNNCNRSFQKRNEPVEYWYCTSCNRVYEVQARSCGKIIRCYRLDDEPYTNELDFSSLTELLVLSDTHMDTLLSKNKELTLLSYLAHNTRSKVYISKDEKIAYIHDTNLDNTKVYHIEDL